MGDLIAYASDFDDARRLSFLAPGVLRGIRRTSWAELALKELKRNKSLDIALLAADLACLIRVNPETPKFGEMVSRYERTFG